MEYSSSTARVDAEKDVCNLIAGVDVEMNAYTVLAEFYDSNLETLEKEWAIGPGIVAWWA